VGVEVEEALWDWARWFRFASGVCSDPRQAAASFNQLSFVNNLLLLGKENFVFQENR
jgi:hypothetical protein